MRVIAKPDGEIGDRRQRCVTTGKAGGEHPGGGGDHIGSPSRPYAKIKWKRENAAAKLELDQLKAEHAKARADRRAKLQAQVDRLSKRLDLKLQRAQARQAA